MKMLALAMWLFLVAPAMADTGNEVLQRCNDGQGSFGQSFCLGYVSASMDAHETDNMSRFLRAITDGAEGASSVRSSYCLPKESTLGQAVRVFVRYAEQHPEKTHVPADRLIRISLEEAFPCPVAR